MNQKTKSAIELPVIILGLLLMAGIIFPKTSFSTWYWMQKAQIPTLVLHKDLVSGKAFFGDDQISQFAQFLVNPALTFLINGWNFLLLSDVVRLALPIIVGAFLSAVGNDLYQVLQRKKNRQLHS